MIPNRPLLKRNYNVVMMPQGYMQLRSEENILLLKGASVFDIVEKLLPLLDGKTTIDQIMESFSGYSRETIIRVIEKLQDYYVIEDGDDVEKTRLSRELIEDYKPTIDYLSLFSERRIHDGTRLNKYELFETLHSKTCFVIGTGKVAHSVVWELAETGVGNIALCEDEDGIALETDEFSKVFTHVVFRNGTIDQITKGSEFDIVVLAEDITTDAKSREVNKLCVDSNIPWISLNMGETRFEVGPLVVPHETACYVCYMNRLNGNKTHLDEDMTYSNFKNLEFNDVTIFTYNTMIRVAAGILTWEVVKYLSKVFSCVTTGRVIHFNILNLEMKSHTVLKMPKCKVCSKVETNPFIEPYAVYLP